MSQINFVHYIKICVCILGQFLYDGLYLRKFMTKVSVA
jgi:hypothetical protein